MCSFISNLINEGCLGCNAPPLLFYDPSMHVQMIAGSNSTAKSYSEFHRKSLPILRDDRLRHGFIQDSADDSPVYGSLKALPLRGGRPLC